MSASLRLRLLTESVQSLTQVAREFPSLRAGKPTHPTAVWRWSKYGIKTPAGQIKLETASLAGRVVTSREAVQRFLRRVAKAKAGIQVSNTAPATPTPTAVPARRQADHKARLDRIGIG